MPVGFFLFILRTFHYIIPPCLNVYTLDLSALQKTFGNVYLLPVSLAYYVRAAYI